MSETVTPLYIAGRGLACALGGTLTTSLAGLAASSRSDSEATGASFFAIEPQAPADAAGWTSRARELITRVVREAGGDSVRHAPLFIASSSLNMGAIERGQPRLGDMHREAEEIAAWLEWEGPLFWISTACTSSLNALLSASRMLTQGRCDEALVLGLELANGYTRSGFGAMQLLSPQRALPLGAERDGLVLGEAVAALRLSTRPQRWRLSGGACVVSGKDATGASQEAIIACWQSALQNGGVLSDAVGLIKLQAAGSPTNDAIELAAVDEVFAKAPALTSLKAHIGHTLGASGAAEIALLTAALEAGIWPGATHAQDPELPHALSMQAPSSCAHVLASIIGFGGSHASILLEDTKLGATATARLETDRSTTSVWEVLGRSDPTLTDDWREELVTLLGARPRRIGNWAEIGLYGALRCMRAAGETTLPPDATLRASSLHGPLDATLQTLHTIAEDGMAMPFSFLQSQPSQFPAILAQALHWQGDARMVNHRDPCQTLAAACGESHGDDILIGWFEEATAANAGSAFSHWLRLRRVAQPDPQHFARATPAALHSCRFITMGTLGLETGDQS